MLGMSEIKSYVVHKNFIVSNCRCVRFISQRRLKVCCLSKKNYLYCDMERSNTTLVGILKSLKINLPDLLLLYMIFRMTQLVMFEKKVINCARYNRGKTYVVQMIFIVDSCWFGIFVSEQRF